MNEDDVYDEDDVDEAMYEMMSLEWVDLLGSMLLEYLPPSFDLIETLVGRLAGDPQWTVVYTFHMERAPFDFHFDTKIPQHPCRYEAERCFEELVPALANQTIDYIQKIYDHRCGKNRTPPKPKNTQHLN